MAQGAMRGLMKDTAIYGLSSILGRFLNWLLFPIYTRVLPTTADYGIVTNLYAWVALLLIILTYGMETAFFRFMNKDRDPRSVYSTTLWSLGVTSILFISLSLFFIDPISQALGYPNNKDYIAMLAIIVAIDAFLSIPYAYLRYAKRPIRFATLRCLFIALNIGLNCFFLLLCPWLHRVAPELISWFYRPDYLVGYIFVSNLLANIVILILMLPHCRTGYVFRGDLLRKMLAYSLPILILGIAGNFNKIADKILYPFLLPDRAVADAELGIYAAGFKIALVQVMFTQAFRYAYEPFIFNKKQGEDADERKNYAMAMRYFVIFSLFIFLAVMVYLDALKLLIPPRYYGGLKVVPFVMLGEMMFGIYFNLSLWYKLIDRTSWGAFFSLLGCALTVLIIVLGVPKYGFMACAYASVISNAMMMLASYFVGKRYYPVPYPLKALGLYTLLTVVLFGIVSFIDSALPNMPWLSMAINTVPLVLFVLIAIRIEFPGGVSRLKMLVRRS